MKKFFILFALLVFVLSFAGCGGGGSMDSPKGENPGKSTLVELTPSHFISHTNSDITLHAKVLDGNGNPVKDKQVRFTNLSPIGVLDKITDKTDANGIATVTLHSHEAGFATIQAEVNEGLNEVRDKKTVYFSSTSVTLLPFMDLDVDGDNNGIYNEPSDFILFETANDNQVVIRATVFDRFGQRVSGCSVSLGSDSAEATFPLGNSADTDENGEAHIFVKVEPETLRDVQTVLNITASACNGAASMVSLFLQPVSISNITVYANPSTVDSGGTSTITAFVTTTAGTPAPDGTTVTFTANKGGIDPFSQTTDGWTEGVTFTAPEVTSDTTATITAKVGGKQATVNVTIIAPPPTPPPAPTPVALAVNPPTASSVVGICATFHFTITGGTPPYTTSSSNINRAFNDNGVGGGTAADCVRNGTELGVWTGSSITVTVPAQVADTCTGAGGTCTAGTCSIIGETCPGTATAGTVDLNVSDSVGGIAKATITIQP